MIFERRFDDNPWHSGHYSYYINCSAEEIDKVIELLKKEKELENE